LNKRIVLYSKKKDTPLITDFFFGEKQEVHAPTVSLLPDFFCFHACLGEQEKGNKTSKAQ